MVRNAKVTLCSGCPDMVGWMDGRDGRTDGWMTNGWRMGPWKVRTLRRGAKKRRHHSCSLSASPSLPRRSFRRSSGEGARADGSSGSSSKFRKRKGPIRKGRRRKGEKAKVGMGVVRALVECSSFSSLFSCFDDTGEDVSPAMQR